MDDLKAFRQWGSKTPGHPECHLTPGVEVTTGPLGQGISNAVGLAIAEAHLAATFNKPGFDVVDHFTFAFCGDGCLMEGVTQEALSLAGHLRLEKLIIVYDDNKITIDGSTDIAYNEDCEAKYRSLGFHTIRVEDGNQDCNALRSAFAEAKSVRGKPKIILMRTTIGFGAKLQGTAKVHGSPLGEEDIRRVKTQFGRDPTKSFFVEPEVYAHFKKNADRGLDQRINWTQMFEVYKAQHPDDAAKYDSYFHGVSSTRLEG